MSWRIGIVGAGRRRNGLGPFLARAFAAAGQPVVATAGRDLAGALASAAALTADLGQPVAAYGDVGLLAQAVDLLVVASPANAHRDGLQAALRAGIPCLCEKPLLPAGQRVAGEALLAAFAARGLLLVENCQWPFVLPALWLLHPALVGAPVERVALGLSPALPGPGMIADSLSHLLSLLQALLPAGSLQPVDVRLASSDPAATSNLLQFRCRGAGGDVLAELHLQLCREQPRPAWLAVNGCRIDRRIGPSYAQSFVADGREQPVADPLQQLVYAVLADLQQNDLERTRTSIRSIAERMRAYDAVLAACSG